MKKSGHLLQRNKNREGGRSKSYLMRMINLLIILLQDEQPEVKLPQQMATSPTSARSSFRRRNNLFPNQRGSRKIELKKWNWNRWTSTTLLINSCQKMMVTLWHRHRGLNLQENTSLMKEISNLDSEISKKLIKMGPKMKSLRRKRRLESVEGAKGSGRSLRKRQPRRKSNMMDSTRDTIPSSMKTRIPLMRMKNMKSKSQRKKVK
jgi:hypothetical protein